ncbi:MAG: hypothetical protein K8T10_20880 [Candidatus Eremiobacteraeota bacterium]|nr:hypothetical protein [Candidatus Eremiobacteraeota bacterium]
MRKTILLFIIASIMVIFLGVIPRRTDAAEKSTNEEIHRLMRDIKTINLINGLYLSNDQMKELLEVVREAKRLEEKIQTQDERTNPETCKVFKKMKAELMRKNDVSEDLKRKFIRIERETHEKMSEHGKRMNELIGKVKKILNENQMVILSEYEACLIPVRSIANPERIGQAGGDEHFMRILSQIRRIPESEYRNVKKFILADHEKMLKNHFRDEKMRKEALERIELAMEQARSLNDEEFEMKKAEISAGVKLELKRPDNLEEFLIRRFLLNPGLEEILQRKIKV